LKNLLSLVEKRLKGKEAIMKKDIEFNAEGIILRGWFYLPNHVAGKVPTIVMAHGFSAVKEMYLDKFAEVFVALAPVRGNLVKKLIPGCKLATTDMPLLMPAHYLK
jgi:hypothetical protein